jgi:hypothetical protein
MSQLGNNHYPRSLPFQAPGGHRMPDTARCPKSSRTARVRLGWPDLPRRTKVLEAAAAALLLVGVTAGVVFVLNRAARDPSLTLPVGGPQARSAGEGHERMLETLGSLSAAHMYQTYLNIGLIADAVESETYSQQQANAMLSTVVGLMDSVDKQLDRLARVDLGAEDKQDVERIRSLALLLRYQVAALRAYWLSSEPEQAARYHQAREKSWTALSEALGLQS